MYLYAYKYQSLELLAQEGMLGLPVLLDLDPFSEASFSVFSCLDNAL